MKSSRRRVYRNPFAFLRDLRAVTSNRAHWRDESLDPAFRERLMLAVTTVNGCRYCSYAHARLALAAGLDAEEVRALGAGDLAGCPPEQLPAVLYAQHWADADARPNSAAHARFVASYDPATVRAIELVLRVIRIGNLLGNTLDAGLQRLTFGLWDRISRR